MKGDMANYVLAHLCVKNIKNGRQTKRQVYDIIISGGKQEDIDDVVGKIKQLLEVDKHDSK